MLELKGEWFADNSRKRIATEIEQQGSKRLDLLTSYSVVNQGDDDFIHNVNLVMADLTTLTALSYLLVDSSGKRPWIVRKSIKAVLDLEESLAYIDELKTWLITQLPSKNRSLLIQTQTIVKNLTEIKYVF